MIDYLVFGEKPISEQYPSQPFSENATHWAGIVRAYNGDPCPLENCQVLAAIETEGENTWQAMLASLSPEQLALLRSVHGSDDPIVRFSYSK